MKKFLFIGILLLASFFASARPREWINYGGIGFRIPTSMAVDADGNYDYSKQFNLQTGGELLYAGVHENGFTIKAVLDVNYTRSDKKNVNDENLSGLNINFLAGAGYAPIHNDKIFIGVFGTFGVDYDYFEYKTDTSPSFTKREIYNAAVIGLNSMTIFTPVKTFSVYGSIFVGCNLPGKFRTESDWNFTLTTDKDDTKVAFKFIPSIGICWKF